MKYLIRGVGGVVVLGIMGVNVLTLVKVEQLNKSTQESAKKIQQLGNDVQELQQIVIDKTDERIQVSSKQFDCLARNIFYEAGVEDIAGKIAVAQVTLNRLKTGKWGDDICSVVYARAQFSWTLDKKKRWAQPKGELWDQSVKVAQEFVFEGKRINSLKASIYYHTDYVKPQWIKDVVKIRQVGQHIFYKPATT